MKKLFLMLLAPMVILTACHSTRKTVETTPKAAEVADPNNPLMHYAYDTPFGVPPFEKITNDMFMPAILEGMKQHKAEIEAIANNTAAPTFENTIIPYDNSGRALSRASRVFFNLNSANTNPEIQRIARELSPISSKHNDEIAMNPRLFDRIKSVYNSRKSINLDAQQLRLVEKYYDDFLRRGANLSAEDQERLKVINEQLSKLSLAYGENVLNETNKNFRMVVDNLQYLKGLPQGVIDAAAITAKRTGHEGKWVFTLDKPSMIPFLQYAENRTLREKLYRGYFMRADNNDKFDNKANIADITALRAERAKLLGYGNFAELTISNNMASTPKAVDEFLDKLFKPALEVAKEDLAAMQRISDSEGNNYRLESWDWWYYAEKLRKQKFDLDESEIRPYLSVQNVRNGMFDVATKLYGITFTPRPDLPKYHPDVEAFEVKEADGSHTGILYLDYYPRESKRGGAWCTSYQTAGWENGKRVYPIVSIVTNFTPPTQNAPALLTWDETETLFHEFGHALHNLFRTGLYARTAGNVPRDFVELPSQIMENWAGEPEVISTYAKHYQTGKPMPADLIKKIDNSSKFNQGFETVEYIAASILDMDYHKLTHPVNLPNVNLFEKRAMEEIGLIDEIIPRYRSTYFSHIFSGGYSAGYYVYLWAAVLDTDAFYAFKESGDLFNKALADKFRRYVLAEGGDDEGMTQYRKFRGKDPSIEPLLLKRGLN